MALRIQRIGLHARVLRLLVTVAAVSTVAALVTPAGAARFKYGKFSGTDVTYTGVTESSSDALPLFGEPTATGNSIDFNPLGYNTISSNGGTLGDRQPGVRHRSQEEIRQPHRQHHAFRDRQHNAPGQRAWA